MRKLLFQEALAKPRTRVNHLVFVANGPSLIGKQLGKVIEEHVRIFRINEFYTESIEDVGKSITDWVVATDSKRLMRVLPKVKPLANASIRGDRLECFWGTGWVARDRLVEKYLVGMPYPRELRWVDWDVCDNLGIFDFLRSYGMDRCSTGVIMLLFLLVEMPDDVISICGFTRNPKLEKGSHYFDRHFVNTRYDYKREMRVVNDLVAERLLRRLD